MGKGFTQCHMAKHCLELNTISQLRSYKVLPYVTGLKLSLQNVTLFQAQDKGREDRPPRLRGMGPKSHVGSWGCLCQARNRTLWNKHHHHVLLRGGVP